MKGRFNYAKVAPGAYEAMDALDQYIPSCGLDRSLVLFAQLRASQLNGCAYCLDMHWKDLVAAGEDSQRLYSLDAWRECPYYSARERAALAWTEAVTVSSTGFRMPSESVQEHLSEPRSHSSRSWWRRSTPGTACRSPRLVPAPIRRPRRFADMLAETSQPRATV